MLGGRILGKQIVNLILTVLQIVAPVLLLASGGFIWKKAGFEYPVQFVTRLAMTIAVPCLIFTALMRTEIDPAALSALTLAALLAYGLLGVLALVAVWALRLKLRSYLAPTVFGNTGNVGLPLALFAFGDQGLGYGVVVFAAMAVFTFTIGIPMVSGKSSAKQLVQEPMIWATVLGGIFLTMGWHTPVWLTNSLELAGGMAIPLMLFTLGVAVARLSPKGIGTATLLSFIKLGLSVGVAVLAGRLLDLEPVAFAVLVLQLATPVAVTSYLLAERYDADPEAVAGYVVISTLLSVLSLPILLYLLL